MTAYPALRLVTLALVVGFAGGCVAAAELEHEELAEQQEPLFQIHYLIEDSSACGSGLRYFTLRWFTPSSCSVHSPSSLCGVRADRTCMEANPRFEAFLDAVCTGHCVEVEPGAPPPPPRSCADCADIPPGQAGTWGWSWCGCCVNGAIEQPCYVAYRQTTHDT